MKSHWTMFALLLGWAALQSGCASRQLTGKEATNELHLIPAPAEVAVRAEVLVPVAGLPLTTEVADLGLPREGYRLSIAPDGIRITGQSEAGVFYGRQTLKLMTETRQPEAGEAGVMLPVTEIVDYPRVAYRSLMLDVSRHFLPLGDVKTFIDWMAAYKYNHLQLHLADDQGWRLEIKKYPKLTEIGSVRGSAEQPYGPFFYTQDEMRDLIAYAAERFITITPEIDIPGHSLAALASYPELGCTGGPYAVWNDIGISEDILCGGNPATLEFLTGVFTEIADLFPGPYVHIGGDECPLHRWEQCPKCQAKMKELNLTNPRDLQRRLTSQIGEVLRRKGKRLIGWDELLASGVPEDAIIMSWRGTSGALRAAERGIDSIVASYSHLYFDYAQGTTAQERPSAGSLITNRRAYSFDPTLGNPALTDKHLIGAQANLWAESIYDLKWLQYKSMPRIFSLAEALWSPENCRDLVGYQNRLMYTYRLLDDRNFEARYAAWEMPDTVYFSGDYTVDFGELPPNMEIIYTLDGSDPADNPAALKYSEKRPHFTDDGSLCMRLILPSGNQSLWSCYQFVQMAAPVSPEEVAPGLKFEVRKGKFDSLEQMRKAPVDYTYYADNFDFLAAKLPEDGFGYVASGYFYAPKSGNYEFSDAMMWGGDLYIDGKLLIPHDPAGGVYYSKVASVYLTEGYHPFKLEYRTKDFGQMQLYVAFDLERQLPLAGEYLVHRK